MIWAGRVACALNVDPPAHQQQLAVPTSQASSAPARLSPWTSLLCSKDPARVCPRWAVAPSPLPSCPGFRSPADAPGAPRLGAVHVPAASSTETTSPYIVLPCLSKVPSSLRPFRRGHAHTHTPPTLVPEH